MPSDPLFKIIKVYRGRLERPVRRTQLPARRARGSLRPSRTAPRASPPGPTARQMVRLAGLGGSAEEAGGGEGYRRSEEGSSHRSSRPEASADPALNEELRLSLHLRQPERKDLGSC